MWKPLAWSSRSWSAPAWWGDKLPERLHHTKRVPRHLIRQRYVLHPEYVFAVINKLEPFEEPHLRQILCEIAQLLRENGLPWLPEYIWFTKEELLKRQEEEALALSYLTH